MAVKYMTKSENRTQVCIQINLGEIPSKIFCKLLGASIFSSKNIALEIYLSSENINQTIQRFLKVQTDGRLGN